MLKQELTKPIILEYSNYRVYLRAVYHYMKATQASFSYRYFSKMAGFKSPNILKLVIEGKRNLSPSSIEKFAKPLKLSKEEMGFFRNLVLLNQAQTIEEKRFHSEQLISSRLYRKIHPLSKAQFAYYAHWYMIPIRELVATEGFQNDPQWIAHQLIPSISSDEAKRALDNLEQLGLIKKKDNGQFEQTETFVSTGDAVNSQSVVQFHKEMIQKGAEALDNFAGREREISSLTLGISETTALQIKELIQKFSKELLTIAEQDSNPERVYQINFQLFPLSKGNKE